MSTAPTALSLRRDRLVRSRHRSRGARPWPPQCAPPLIVASGIDEKTLKRDGESTPYHTTPHHTTQHTAQHNTTPHHTNTQIHTTQHQHQHQQRRQRHRETRPNASWSSLASRSEPCQARQGHDRGRERGLPFRAAARSPRQEGEEGAGTSGTCTRVLPALAGVCAASLPTTMGMVAGMLVQNTLK